MVSIEEKAIKFVIEKYEKDLRGKKARDARPDRLGYDVQSEDRKIEVKATKASVPNKAGLHITLLPHQYKALQNNPDYWIYRVYNVGSKGKEKVIPIPRNEILTHLEPYTVHKLVLKKEEWKKLEKKIQ